MNAKNYFEKYIEKDISGRLIEILDFKINELLELKKRESNYNCEEKFYRYSLFEALNKPGNIGLIAEVKKASPSEGIINLGVDILKQAKHYEESGADAISVLTDKKFFAGNINYLRQIKQAVSLPVLRKDFIFDPYQIYESKYYGADAVLLIATVLKPKRLQELINLAYELGLECLVEIHNNKDLEKVLTSNAKIIGINARNLENFEVDLQNVIDLAKCIPKDKIVVAESGIRSAGDVRKISQVGIKNILVGTSLMRASDVSEKIRELRLDLT